MKIEIIDSNRNLITSFELESNPLKVGEVISIDISNNDKWYWTVDEVKSDFKIKKIEHYLRKQYSLNGRYSENFCVSVEVSKIN